MRSSRWPLLVRRSALEARTAAAQHALRRSAVPPFPVPPRVASDFGVYCADTGERVVALTYDDGPHPEVTPRLLDVLARRGATATFFVLAARAEEHPEIVRRAVAEGHEVALHGADHRSLLTLGDDEAVAAVTDARHRVERVTGTPVTLYRPPYGHHTAGQARGLRAAGLEVVIWSADPTDWKHAAEDEIVERVVDAIFPGGVVLMHDDRADPETAADPSELPRFSRPRVLESLLDRLAEGGWTTSTVGDLLRRHRPVRSRSARVRTDA
jgi:peptidoglycan/xylan/chitin deacetylase (PgdA/CDA1 family)